jgi:dolichyl-phosphate beta-glucosyltransferase
MTSLSVVIPAYNEADNCTQGVLDQVHKYLSAQKYPHEVIIVDDGSTDNTSQLVKKFIADKPAWQLIANPHQGKAQTVAAGINQAQYDAVLFTDFDQATPIAEVEKLLPFLKRGYDVVIGSREVEGSKRRGEPRYRHLMGRGFNFFVSLFAFGNIHDTQCGFKLFKTPVGQKLFSQLVVYGPNHETRAFTGAFDVEVLYLAHKRRFAIAEVPVFWTHVTTPRVSPIRDSIRMFLDLIRIRLTDLMGRYNEI